jgi:hypothetical protein
LVGSQKKKKEKKRKEKKKAECGSCRSFHHA